MILVPNVSPKGIRTALQGLPSATRLRGAMGEIGSKLLLMLLLMLLLIQIGST